MGPLAAKGISIPLQIEPLEESFPLDLTREGDRQLGKLLSLYTAHLSRSFYLLSLAESELLIAEQERDRAIDHWTFRFAPENPRDELKVKTMARVKKQKQVMIWEDRALAAKARVVVLKGVKESFLAYRDAISREITRRMDEAKRSGRIT